MTRIRRGFSTLGGNSYETPLECGGEYGFDFVELDMIDYDADLLAANADDIRSIAAENDLDLLVHLPYRPEDLIGSSDETVRRESVERMRAAIRGAGAIGAEKGVLHIESGEEPHLLETDPDQLVETLTELDDFARDHGVQLSAENMLQARPDPDDLPVLADRVGVDLTVDTGHARSTGHTDEDVAAFLGDHADAVSHLHLNDTRSTEDEHLPFGAGTVDFESIFGALPADWDGTMTLEIFTYDYDYVEFSLQKLDEVL